MKYFKFIYIFLLTFYSCDFSFSASLRNETDQNIEITITYDKKLLDSLYQGRDYSKFVPAFTTMPSTYNKSYDSSNKSIIFTLPPNGTVQIEHGPTGYSIDKPDLGLIKNLKIITNNREINYPANSLDKAFSKVRRNEFELLIK